jgi:putative tryptophan/tyrosine transport system substrate-binding protein
LPGLARVALLLNPVSVANTALTLRDVEEAARTLGVQIQAFNANTGHEIDAAFQSMERGRPDALFVAITPFFIARRIQLVQLATFHRLRRPMGCAILQKLAV